MMTDDRERDDDCEDLHEYDNWGDLGDEATDEDTDSDVSTPYCSHSLCPDQMAERALGA